MKLYAVKLEMVYLIGAEDEEEALDRSSEILKDHDGCFPMDVGFKEIKKESQLPTGVYLHDEVFNLNMKIGEILQEKQKKKQKVISAL